MVTKKLTAKQVRLRDLKKAKKAHKYALQNRVMYTEKRNTLVQRMLEFKIPNWGGIKLILVNWM